MSAQTGNANEMAALDAYINRVYRIIVLIIPAFCICASVSRMNRKAGGILFICQKGEGQA